MELDDAFWKLRAVVFEDDGRWCWYLESHADDRETIVECLIDEGDACTVQEAIAQAEAAYIAEGGELD